jgi:RHS repeat-associated protein
MKNHYYAFGERDCSSHTKWLVGEVKRNVRPAVQRGAAMESKHFERQPKCFCGERAYSSHTQWLVGEVKRNVRPAVKRGAAMESKHFERQPKCFCGERACSSHTQWLVGEVKRNVRPAVKRGAAMESKHFERQPKCFCGKIERITGTTYEYQYYIKDHLGNVRVVFKSRPTLISEHHYYPFGLNQEGSFYTSGTTQKYKYNGKELVGSLGWYDYGFRYYDPSICKFPTVDPRSEKYPVMSPYNYVGNNPINYIDPRGDTLRAVNHVSAERALDLIQSGIPSPSSAKNLFSLGADGITFNSISSEALNNALGGLNVDQAALVIGYSAMINGSETNVVEIVKRGESISSYGQVALGGEVKTGADLDEKSGGGYSGQAHYDGSTVRLGADGPYGIVTANSSTLIDYNFGSRRALAGETLAHELLGHGLGKRGGRSDGQQLDASIQTGNTYLRTQGRNYFRQNHGVSNHTKGFNPNATPSYLSRIPYINF